MEIALKKPFFPERECVFTSQGSLRCSLFLYSTGVEAVRIENELGHIIMLPFKGQQIWDAVFHGRRLAMQSVFPEPRNMSLRAFPGTCTFPMSSSSSFTTSKKIRT
jgi:hypothetical protein